MKFIAFFFLAICFYFNSLSAQGTLQFNQVLLLQTSQSGSVLLGTVPAGKVWKIEAAGGVPQNFCRCRFSFDVTSSTANSAFSIGWLLATRRHAGFHNMLQLLWIRVHLSKYRLPLSFHH